MMLTQERLHSLLHYDPITGAFSWATGRKGARKGRHAGRIDSDGYRTIKIDYKDYRAARLAVLWMTGRWPKHQVDHKNRARDDDRWTNIQPATNQQNAANRRGRTNCKGVRRDSTGRYSSRVTVKCRCVWLGRFDNPVDAHAAYVTAAQWYFGEFAGVK
jgi:hypothetical protein